MDINVLIICITVVVCFVFATAAAVYVTDHKLKKHEAVVAFLARLSIEAMKKAKEEEGDE